MEGKEKGWFRKRVGMILGGAAAVGAGGAAIENMSGSTLKFDSVEGRMSRLEEREPVIESERVDTENLQLDPVQKVSFKKEME